jgi:hypothetical protein
MTVTTEVTSSAIPLVNAEISFGILTGQFDYIDAYVDATTVASSNRIKWRLYCIFPGVTPCLVAESLPIPANAQPNCPFQPIQMIVGATYELRAVAVDAPITTPILGGLAGSIAEALAPIVSTGSFVLSPIAQTTFATVGAYRSEFQAQVDAAGQNLTASTWRLFGSITGAGGTITAEIGIGQFADSSPSSIPYIVFSSANINSGLSGANLYSGGPVPPPLRARGANSYSLTGISQDSTGSIGPVNATLIGFDRSCCARQTG